MAKTLYEAKLEKVKKKNNNIITDMDYVFRDKAKEAEKGYPNTLDMTPDKAVTTRAKKAE